MMPSLFVSGPRDSITSGIPSPSLSLSIAFGLVSLSRLRAPRALPEFTGPVLLPSTFWLRPSPSVSLNESISPSPFASTPPASTTSGIPSLSLSRSRMLMMPSRSISNRSSTPSPLLSTLPGKLVSRLFAIPSLSLSPSA